MILLRILGYFMALAGFGFMIVDGARSIAAGGLLLTPMGKTWFDLHAASLNGAQAAIERYVDPFLWDPIVITVLQWPSFVVALVLGLVLVLIGRPRRKRTNAAAWY